MAPRSRAVPRFLPTLTEVVQPADANAASPSLAQPSQGRTEDDLEARMLDRVRAAVTPCLREAVDGWLREQLESPGSPLSQQIEALAREAWVTEFAARLPVEP